jgi:hypothetical protein
MRNARCGAGRDQELRADQAARTVSALDLHFMVRNQARLAGDHLHMVGIIEQALVLVGAVLLDNLILLSHQLRPTERHVDRGEARIPWVGGIVDEAGCLNQVLGGETPPVGAGASDRAKFGHDGAFAKLSGVQGRGKGCRATAQNHQVISFLH